jgi:ABC-type phosphate transport system substrate-binding protein
VTRPVQTAIRVGAALTIAGAVLIPGAAADAAQAPYAAISGAGSSWSALLIDEWTAHVATADQLTVNFQPNGSAEGRQLYKEGVVDFAASDPPFRNGTDNLDPNGKESELPVAYGYSYVPDTAGGTAFMYHLDVGGHQITNLRLSPQTLMEIFTGKITTWNNPAIEHDYGASLPDIPIIPVVRSDGSGATFFLTRYFSHMFPAQWNAFCSQVTKGKVRTNCGPTEFYPTKNWGSNVKAENGSTNVANFITASYANGAIGYDEYAYALNSGYPVVSVLNPAGYYVTPSAGNVAVALTQAKINEDASSPNFLQQNLDDVYTYKDPRSYPLSSYSYLIVPRVTPGKPLPSAFKKPMGRSLSTFIDYFLCAGQADAANLGYSPIPLNLVKGGLLQVTHIPSAGSTPNPTTMAGCDNPTFTNGVLTVLKTAPYPNVCQYYKKPLTCSSTETAAPDPGGRSRKPASGSSSPAASTSASATATDTPGVQVGAGGAGSNPDATSTDVAGQVVNLASDDASQPTLAAITAVAILVAVAAPPTLAIWLRRRRRQSSG